MYISLRKICSALNSRNRDKTALRFCLLFVVVFGAEFAIFILWGFSKIGPFLAEWNAQATAWILRLLGADGQAHGVLVTSSLFSAKIVFECTATFVIMIFVAAVVAYHCGWRYKLLGIGGGVPAIFLANLVRLVSLFYIGYWFPTAFEEAHQLAWQSLMVFFVLFLWLFWIVKVVHRHEHQSA